MAEKSKWSILMVDNSYGYLWMIRDRGLSKDAMSYNIWTSYMPKARGRFSAHDRMLEHRIKDEPYNVVHGANPIEVLTVEFKTNPVWETLKLNKGHLKLTSAEMTAEGWIYKGERELWSNLTLSIQR